MANDIKQLKKELAKWKALYKGVADANRRIMNENKSLHDSLKVAIANLESAQMSVDMNKRLLRQTMEEHNMKEQELIGLLTRLKAKLREMGYNGNFDSLGN